MKLHMELLECGVGEVCELPIWREKATQSRVYEGYLISRLAGV